MALIACPYDVPSFDNMSLISDEEDYRALETIIVENEVKSAVEVGSWAGATALIFARHCDTVHCVDTWQGTTTDGMVQLLAHYGCERAFETFCQNMGDDLFVKVHPLRVPSRLAARVWRDPVDMVYLDAGHSFDECSDDIFQWKRHVKPGGILAGHDYNRRLFPGVVRAVDAIGPDGVEGTVWWKRM